ncbi:hypothetical protein DK150_370069 [Flavobacterium psychrophilum]|uniref:hypothetical protein n=1 Tax=Flavobacterium psychrophilum TaxID=96345 RepID=UPI000B7C479A|nr:hypothetical protein [Flavobacterium psychrophilum]SNA76247.1 hypothetical protein DK150_370069 [Flavobacterium psychrophilum]
MQVSIHEKAFNTLKNFESGLQELIQELQQAKATKKDIDKVNLVVSKLQSTKQHFNDK